VRALLGVPGGPRAAEREDDGTMSTTRSGGEVGRSYAATLGCGSVLTYEASSFLPDVGEVVPCRRHGFCEVVVRDHSDGRSRGRTGAVPPRSQRELLAFLGGWRVTTVHVLRRRRFTLRVVLEAQRAGLVDVDLVSGRVALRDPGAQVSPATRPGP